MNRPPDAQTRPHCDAKEYEELMASATCETLGSIVVPEKGELRPLSRCKNTNDATVGTQSIEIVVDFRQKNPRLAKLQTDDPGPA